MRSTRRGRTVNPLISTPQPRLVALGNVLKVQVIGGDGQDLVEIEISLDALVFPFRLLSGLFLFLVGIKLRLFLEELRFVEGVVLPGFPLLVTGDLADDFLELLGVLHALF